jgi:hypothetical protein
VGYYGFAFAFFVLLAVSALIEYGEFIKKNP